MVHLDYRDIRPIYTQITDGFRQQIQAGILKEGDRLPSVRELAGSLAINPNTIQRAYRELESQGLIATVPGKGCFVCSQCPRDTELRQCLENFDNAASALLALGMTREQLLARLKGE